MGTTFQADKALVDAEIARLAAVQPGDDYGYELAFVRRICLRRLGITHAAAVLRQEAIFALSGENVPYFGPDAPNRGWAIECNRMHFLAGTAIDGPYRLPEPHEIINLVRNSREQRIREAGREFRRWW